MARPKKKRGYRPIIVNDKQYRWRFAASVPRSSLYVTTADTSGQTLIVNMTDWINPWFNLAGFMANGDEMILYVGHRNKPEIITNRFVRRVILFALEHGWQPDTAAENFYIEYYNGELTCPDSDSPTSE
ncbi:MAG: hypothetical protein AAF787_18000 [Chloroflexota bacterium]